MAIVAIVVLLPVGLLLAYFWVRFRRGHAVAEHMRLFADVFDDTYRTSGSKEDALAAALNVFATCPRLRDLTQQETATVVAALRDVRDPKRVILNILVALTADNALKALRNEALLRKIAGACVAKRAPTPPALSDRSGPETRRDSRVLVGRLKKQTRIRLANGWEAVLLDNANREEPNTRTATVYGDFTETGSIYVSTIREAFLGNRWVTVTLDEDQRQFSKAVNDFLRQGDCHDI